MKIALAQYEVHVSVDRNVSKVITLMSEAKRAGAELLLLPELCLAPFFPQFAGQDVSQYLMNSDDEAIRRLQTNCRALGIAAVPNIYLREGSRRFDASILISKDGCIQGISKMVHIAQVPCFYEQDYYEPSDTGFPVHDTAWGKVGIVVCFDRHYPESIRTCVLRGASLILIPTANTIDEPRDIFECELRTAAFQNGVYIAMCNRTGTEGDVVFCGESVVIDPFGSVIARGSTSEELVTADLDPGQLYNARAKRPYLALRNPEMYECGEKEPRGGV